MAPKITVPFATNVNKRMGAIIRSLRGLAALGPRCEDPAQADKVRAALSAELERVHTAWAGKAKPLVGGFEL
jgi:hypothetical protein